MLGTGKHQMHAGREVHLEPNGCIYFNPILLVFVLPDTVEFLKRGQSKWVRSTFSFLGTPGGLHI